ncbi:uncharacterized protein MKK02DRAFT_19725 [Dioszegia hungarica]|uniref:Nicotinamide-nucleotide adenylyltransferase n=1 Tax=Dioszegia hungarica TaxID=4972 RepID=A0AA38H5R6_9TREE|nr:uncharacterized protein MKK02DRAFT_19725 [Dioszegia hungarica]KAI9632959.1 hypothetical protein MKK02DRAFT_19725 [Dioszegia hungarica]
MSVPLATPSRDAIQAAIDRVSADRNAFELIHVSQPTWPFASEASQSSERAHIVILDSSFNPPHFAHEAMASSTFPPPLVSSDVDSQPPYSARLLLFSVRNIQKTPKAGDASPVQRLEMTLLLAARLAKSHALPGGVAVGILNEPTFVGKSRILHSHLSSPISPTASSSTSVPPAGRRIKLSFLIGSDTLTRFFQPSFYGGISGMNAASEEYFGMGSLLICGRRGEGKESRAVEQEVLDREEVRPWVEKGLVRMLESNQGGQEDISSTTIRTAIRDGDDAVLGGLIPEEIMAYIRREGLYTS